MRKYLLIKYIKRETSLAEDSEVYAWVTKNSQNESYFANLRNLYTLSTIPEETLSLEETIEATNKIFAKAPANGRHNYFKSKKLLVAASLISLLIVSSIVGLFFFKDNFSSFNNIVLSSGLDSVKVVSLPDGSTLLLGSNSQIKYSKNFGKSNRNVYAKGKVFFEVVSNKHLPMHVYTSCGMKVSVLGTTFVIDDNEAGFSTMLVEGKIKVEVSRKCKSKERFIYLAPNDRLEVDKEGNLNLFKVENTNDYLEWKNDVFTFNNQSLDEVLRIMSAYYNVEFKCDPSLGSMMLTINLSNKSLEEFLSIVGYALSVSHKNVGDLIFFYR